MVRLKDRSDRTTDDYVPRFQFHSGSIKRTWMWTCERSKRCFNSIVVRLKGRIVEEYRADHEQFQFHSGSIKRGHSFLPPKRRVLSFNSIVVRLKEVGGLQSTHVPQMFQFHSGSIKSTARTCQRPGS